MAASAGSLGEISVGEWSSTRSTTTLSFRRFAGLWLFSAARLEGLLTLGGEIGVVLPRDRLVARAENW